MTDLYIQTLERMASVCDSGGHELCQRSLQCRTALEVHIAVVTRQQKAATFDAGEERLRRNTTQPDHSWSTAALLRTAHDLIISPPMRNPWWRSIAITTALARLGERELSADAIVRTGFARDIVWTIVHNASAFWCATKLEAETEIEIPAVLEPWVKLLEADQSLVAHRGETPAHVASVALAGPVGEAAENWMRTSAIGHILGWRIDDFMRVDREPLDLVFAGGRDVTLWIVDRFTRTFLPDWQDSSINWEQVYNADPAATAEISGVPLPILQERTVTTEMVSDALCVRLHKGVPSTEQLDLGESPIAALAVMLESGQHQAALRLARKMHEARPNQLHFALAYAFCLIVHDPGTARAILERLDIDFASSAGAIRAANLATCALMDGNLPRIRDQIAVLKAGDLEHHAWFWSPADILQGEPHIRYQSISSWLDQLFEAARSFDIHF